MAASSKQGTLSSDQAIAILGKSRAWFFDRVREGHIAKESRGRYSLVALIRGVVAYYDHILTKQSLTQAASRATDARTREIEQRISMRERQLIPIEDAEQAVHILVGVVNEELSGLSSRVTRDVALRKQIEAEVHGSKARIAAALGKAAEASRTGVGLEGAEP